MYFKVACHTKPIYLEEDQKIEFSIVENGETIYLTLERIPETELGGYYKKGDVRCVSIVERTISEEQNKQIDEFKHTGHTELNGFIAALEEKLCEIVQRTVHSYRWYRGIPNSHNLIKSWIGMFCSENNNDWILVYGSTKVHMVVNFGPSMKVVNPEFTSNLRTLVESKANEPIGHELLAEAIEQRSINPRSALLIGIAALETGFKGFVSGLIPDVALMVENAPTPPLVGMLKKFLPDLPCRLNIYGKVLPPPQELIKLVDDGVQLRNKLAHGKKIEVQVPQLEKLLNAIRDILYLLDYYGGQKWAFNHIGVKTIGSLVNQAQKP